MKYVSKHKKIWIPLATAMAGLVLNILFEISGLTEISARYSQVRQVQYSVNYTTGLLLYGIVAPVAEEVIFRFICFNLLKKCLPLIPSAVISALLFGAYHGNLVQGIYGFLMGMMLALGYHATRDFKTPVISHGLCNVLMFSITMFM